MVKARIKPNISCSNFIPDKIAQKKVERPYGKIMPSGVALSEATSASLVLITLGY